MMDSKIGSARLGAAAARPSVDVASVDLASIHRAPRRLSVARLAAGAAASAASFVLIGGLAILPNLGCAKTQSTMNQHQAIQPSGQPQLASDVHERVHDLQDRINDLASESSQLPGRHEEDYRRTMNEVFGSFSQILPLLQGAEQTNEFEQQMRIVQTDQAELANGSRELDSTPTVDQGLRSIFNALSRLAIDKFAEQADVGKAIETLHGRIDELDSVLGPNHRVVVGEVVEQSLNVVELMTNALATRIGMTPQHPNDAAPANSSQPGAPQPGGVPQAPQPGPAAPATTPAIPSPNAG